MEAEIDAETSSVILPADRFTMTEWEQGELLSANSISVAKCAREKLGIQHYGSSNWDVVPAESLMFAELGPWTPDMADRFGFAKPGPKGYLSANGIGPKPKNNDEIDTAYAQYTIPDHELDTVVEECGGASNQHFQMDGFYDGPWVSELSKTWDSALEDERFKTIVSELKSCYEREGLEVSISSSADDSGSDGRIPLVIAGADTTAIDEQQISMANKVVNCKSETNAIVRITDIWAEK